MYNLQGMFMTRRLTFIICEIGIIMRIEAGLLMRTSCLMGRICLDTAEITLSIMWILMGLIGVRYLLSVLQLL